MLKTLVEEGWFEKSIKGFYSLSPRALTELRGWLLETYNDLEEDEEEEGSVSKRIKQCFACREIITTVSWAAPSHFFSSTDSQSRVNGVPRRAARAACTIYAHRISSELRAHGNALYVRQTGRAMTSLVKGHLFRRSTSLRKGEAVVELWLEGNRLWSWKRMRKRMRPRKRKTIDMGLQNPERSKEDILQRA